MPPSNVPRNAARRTPRSNARGSHRNRSRRKPLGWKPRLAIVSTISVCVLLGWAFIVRSLAPRDLVRNVGSAWELLVAAGRAVRLVGRAKPRVVVAVGGYASLAGSVGALVHRVPLVLVNVDAVPGAANRLLGRFAAASAVGWEDTPLPRAVVTGTPVRPQIAAVDRSAAARSTL